MNQLQKKSLVFSLILGALNVFLSFNPDTFLIVFISNIFITAFFGFYLFDVSIKKEDLVEKSKLFILPLLLNFGSVVFINGLFQLGLRVVFALLIALVNYSLFVASKKVQNLEERAAITQRNIIISVSFFSIFLSLSAMFRTHVLLSTSGYSTFSLIALVVSVGLVVYLVSYFLAWENGIGAKKLRMYNLVGALLAMEAALFGSIWIINYPVFSSEERANLGGFPIPAIVLTIIFYFIWGIISHKMDKSLTRRILMEYVLISVVFLIVLFVTASWLPII